MALSIIELATQFPAVKNSTAAHLAKPLSGCLAHQLLSGDKFVVVQSNQTFFSMWVCQLMSQSWGFSKILGPRFWSPLSKAAPKHAAPGSPPSKTRPAFRTTAPCGLGRFSGRLAQRASAGFGFHCPVPCILPIDLTPRSRIFTSKGTLRVWGSEYAGSNVLWLVGGDLNC